MKTSLVRGSEGNEGDCATRNEAYTSEHTETHKETSGEALSSISDTHVSG